MDDRIEEIVNAVYDLCGIDVSGYEDTFLAHSLEKRFSVAKTDDIADYIRHLAGNPDEAAILLRSLTVTHTEFFRNPLTFAHLEQWILPSLMEAKSDHSELRVWSAGCSTGQEAYSIAILAENINSQRQRPVRYRIVATDISQEALLEASRGEYREAAIQKIRVGDLKEHFLKSGETYAVCDRLKQHISFSSYDLLDNRSSCPQESIFGGFDLVVCSNLLFYYQRSHQERILKKLVDSMDENGYLITGEAERLIVRRRGGLCQVAPPSPIYKISRGAR
jgi:chemotaxis methyl-accepting protein methylase